MYDLAEFEIHAITDPDVEGWLVLIHRPCGANLGDENGYDMIDLQSAAQLTMGHECKAPHG